MDRFLLRRDSLERWESENPVLLEGEIGLVLDTKSFKIGDGIHNWNDLDYSSDPTIMQAFGNSESALMSLKVITNSVGFDTYQVFSTSKRYVKDELVNYEGNLYRFINDHSGVWNEADVESANLRDKLVEVCERTTDLGELNCDNLLKRDEFDYSDTIAHGVTFKYLGEGKYHVYGTAIRDVSHSFYVNRTQLPNSFIKKHTYQILYSGDKVGFLVNIYNNKQILTGLTIYNNSTFTIPYNAEGVILGIRVLSGTTIDEVVHPILIEDYTSEQVREKLDNVHSMGVVSATGNPVVLENVSASPINELSITPLSGTDLITVCGKNMYMVTSETYKRINNGVTYNLTVDTINIVSDGATANSLSSGTNFPLKYWTLNGQVWYHNFKFKFANDTWITISGNCSVPLTYDFKALLQVGDGINPNLYVDEDGLTFLAKAGIEYGVRALVLQGFSGNVTFYPQVEIGTHKTAHENFNGSRYIANEASNIIEYLKKRGTKLGRTVIYTNTNALITVLARARTDLELANYARETSDKINELSANKSVSVSKRKPMISFIDDDTSSIALVKRYHDLFASKGVVGGYAVMTKNLNEQEGLSDLLLQYELEGFACLYHCYYQRGNETRYWEANNPMYDESLIKENFIRGLRDMERYGFLNYKHWITPYGVNDTFIKNLAKNHGMECLMTMSGNLSANSFVSRFGNCDRYNIPRISISSSSNLDRTKSIIDGCVADNGWIVIVTHANTWGSGTEIDEKVADIIQYALDSGMEVKSFPEAFEDYRASFYFNELF